MKELARKQKEKMLKEEQDKIERAIKLHEERRQSMRGEVELESIAKRLQQEKKTEEDKESLKQNLSLASLTKRIGKFKDILTQELSDSEEEEKSDIVLTINDISENVVVSNTDVSNNDVSNNDVSNNEV